MYIILFIPILGVGGDDGGDDDGGGRISWQPSAPIPSRTGMKYPVRATPSLQYFTGTYILCKGELVYNSFSAGVGRSLWG